MRATQQTPLGGCAASFQRVPYDLDGCAGDGHVGRWRQVPDQFARRLEVGSPQARRHGPHDRRSLRHESGSTTGAGMGVAAVAAIWKERGHLTMRRESMNKWLVAIAWFLASVPPAASAAEVKVMISAGFFGVYSEL